MVIDCTVGLPGGVESLVAESRAEGFDFLPRLVDDWRSGANRFDGPGEVLLTARQDGRLVGLCGLNRDPYAGDPSVGRLRHLYVTRARRRAGIGRALVLRVLGTAAGGPFRVIRLRTTTAAADRFYLALGFERAVSLRDATHVYRLG